MAAKSKLTDQQWAEIKTRYIEGESQNSLSKEFGISVSTLNEKKQRENWDIDRAEYRTKIKTGVKNRIEKKITETEKPKPKESGNIPNTENNSENIGLDVIIEKAANIKVNALSLLEKTISRADALIQNEKAKLKMHEVLSAAKVASEGIENVDRILGINNSGEEDRIKSLIEKMDEI